MKRKIFLTVILSSAFLSARALTVDDLVQIALKHSPDISIGDYEYRAAHQRSRISESVRLPQISATAALEHGEDRFEGSVRNHSDALTGGLRLDQLLYDFGRSSGSIEAARENEMLYRARLRQIVSDKVYQVKLRYYDALKAKTQIRVQEKNLKLQKEQLHRAERFLKAGIKTMVDVTDARLHLEQARKSLSDARYLLRLRRALLEESLGVIPEEGRYTLYNSQKEMTEWKLPGKETPLPELLRYALKHRPLLQGVEHGIRSAEAAARGKEAHYAPILNLVGEAAARHEDSKLPPSMPTRHAKVGVELSWDLFSGYRDSAEAQEARIHAMKARAQKDRAMLTIRREVTQADLNLRQKREAFRLSRAIVAQAKEKFRQAQKRYDNDLADYIELQEARQSYIDALSGLVNSYYDYYAARAQLDRAIGR
ncbi:TolC family protein [Nitratifractor sp.]|uniref:TolC family protein n=1 Tax=Nitratifractor sp. TaxID=2268144 RepID=UPI0025CB7D16|nr:TolC family protein [Nitratifractor sp.]